MDVKPEVSDHFWLVAKTFLGYWNKMGVKNINRFLYLLAILIIFPSDFIYNA